MKFGSEVTRMLYHSLPTEVQVSYSRLEERLADDGKELQIESVMLNDNDLDVVVRISEQLDHAAG